MYIILPYFPLYAMIRGRIWQREVKLGPYQTPMVELLAKFRIKAPP